MKKILPIILLFIMLSYNLKAFHIVGGEIELVHVNGFTYNLNLIQYFDAAQADNPAPDQSVTVYIYENGTNAKVDEYLLPLQYTQSVPYTTPDCAIGQLQTLRPYYSRQVTLDPDKYSNPAGYYVVWERCCRNASVVNLNNATGTSVGMTYVLEFPAIMKNGEPFVNSTPQLFPPLSDYACINQLYYTSFAGIDVDGDSLVYSLTTPLNSSSSDPVPIPKAKPHFPVVFANGFDQQNMVPGDPSLQISNKGFLTVEPEFTGLFVFSVLVEEYRDDIKIGQVTRDFQMLVIDGCDPPVPPDAQVRLPGEDEFYNEVDTIRFTVADEKCFEFLVTDDVGDLVTFRAEGVNFEQKVEDIFEFNQDFINSNRDTLRVEVCIPDCPYVRDEPFIIDLLAADNACPLPQIDTVRLTIFVEPPPNDAPQFQTTTKTRTISIPEGQVYSEKFIGRDGDGDFLVTTIEPIGFELDDYGMSLNLTKNLAGENEVEFNWDAKCLTYDFNQKSNFELSLILEDLDVCSQPVADTILFDLTVDLPPNSDPVITTGLGDSPAFSRIDTKLEFNVNVKDADNDIINLKAFAPDFNMQELGLVFDDVSGVGEINSLFSWQLDCEVLDIDQSKTYNIYFVAEDEDDCKFSNSDTLKVVVNVIVPYNNKPEFDLYPDYELTVNEPFSLDITASDSDNDFISVDLLEGVAVPPSPSFSFGRVSGEGQVTSTLEWTPECSLLDDDFAPKKYNVFFLVWDGRCPVQKYDTMSIIFEIKELEVDYDTFLPANAFTPNGDALNNTFKLTDLPIPEQNLPPDNCEDQFMSIVIVDRKGKTVFESDDRNFEWTGNGMPASTYYYSIRYLHTDFRGTISILY
ncbi:gliding motility-associated C-terminal domain-containing protein [Reichenbachiella sp. MALMAid0571]|uniref:T9SS type B sorting domain-containing protein n=1 Tax=Reichenbachiella sp. MALMAid0571 TaxID=3143939 RepID=UPI0032DFC398